MGMKYRQTDRSFDSHNVMRELKIRNNRSGRFLAKAVLELFRMYCYSAKETPKDAVDPLVQHLGKCTLSNFLRGNRHDVARLTGKLYDRMRSRKIEAVPDDFYFKEFALTKAHKALSKFNIILADEAQDHNEVTAQILINANASTVFVGDSCQQVYAWRYAVNTLKKVEGYPEYRLTGAFRFGEEIASVVNRVIGNATREQMNLEGLGPTSSVSTYEGDRPPLRPGWMYLSRTNGELLKLADDAIDSDCSLYVEGGIESFQFKAMYHILDLLLGEKPKHPFFRLFPDIEELQEYCDAIGDRSMQALIAIVKKYKKYLYILEKKLKRNSADQMSAADVVLSTAHKAKGLEFDRVALLPNFAREIIDDKESEVDLEDWRTREEINLLYVAMTRAMNRLLIPADVAALTPRRVSCGSARGNSRRMRNQAELPPIVRRSPDLQPFMAPEGERAGYFALDIVDSEGDEVFQWSGLPTFLLPNGQYGVLEEGRVWPVWLRNGEPIAYANRLEEGWSANQCMSVPEKERT